MSSTPPPKILTHYVCVSAAVYHALRAFAAMKQLPSEAHVADLWLTDRIKQDQDLQWMATQFKESMKKLDAEYEQRTKGRASREAAVAGIREEVLP